MKIHISIAAVIAAVALAAMPVFAAESGDSDQGQMDHSAMDHSMGSGDSTARDEKGRRLHGMKHQMTPEQIADLKENVPLFKNYSDAEIALSMEMMGPNYEWYLSGPDVRGKQAVLVLMHGFGDQGDEMFRERMEGMANIFPMAMAAGMSMMMSQHIQLAIDDLEAAGAELIVVVPIVSTEHNTMMRQWEYIFGMRDKPEYAAVPRVKSNAKIVMVSPPNDDPLVAEILIDRAYEISTDPDNEVVIIAAHGPTFEADNLEELKMLGNLARIVREDSDFKDVTGVTLQDDAPPEVRDANVQKLRGLVSAANKEGKDVLIVTNLIGSRTIQAKLRKDLKGLDYKFNAKGIYDHDNFMKWMGDAVRRQFERNKVADAN